MFFFVPLLALALPLWGSAPVVADQTTLFCEGRFQGIKEAYVKLLTEAGRALVSADDLRGMLKNEDPFTLVGAGASERIHLQAALDQLKRALAAKSQSEGLRDELLGVLTDLLQRETANGAALDQVVRRTGDLTEYFESVVLNGFHEGLKEYLNEEVAPRTFAIAEEANAILTAGSNSIRAWDLATGKLLPIQYESPNGILSSEYWSVKALRRAQDKRYVYGLVATLSHLAGAGFKLQRPEMTYRRFFAAQGLIAAAKVLGHAEHYSICTWEVATGRLVRRVSVDQALGERNPELKDLAILSNDEVLLLSRHGGNVWKWNMKSSKKAEPVSWTKTDFGPGWLDADLSGRRVLVGAQARSSVMEVGGKTLAFLEAPRGEKAARYSAISPLGNFAATVRYDGRDVLVLDLRQSPPTPIATLRASDHPVWRAQFSADEKVLTTVSDFEDRQTPVVRRYDLELLADKGVN